jgi:hypothetical protein
VLNAVNTFEFVFKWFDVIFDLVDVWIGMSARNESSVWLAQKLAHILIIFLLQSIFVV